MIKTVTPPRRLSGSVRVPADKSIAHRAAILAGIATGTSRLGRYPDGQDTLATLRCLRQLGVELEWDGDAVVVHGRGLDGLRQPDGPLDCGNSGTAMRLLAGLLAGRPFDSVLVGDASLSSRPMRRVADPLNAMGASIELTEGHAPINISRSGRIQATRQTLSIASAQVKSAIILAAIQASERSMVVEPVLSRDHTERMLGLNASIQSADRLIEVDPIERIDPIEIEIPGDFSSAAFFIAGASIVGDSEVRLEGVGVNPTRTGMLDVLEAAGANVERGPESGGREPVADLRIRSSALEPFRVGGDMVPRLIDEIPVLAVMASLAAGDSVFTDVGELRAKETDRIAAVEACLRQVGGRVTATADTMTVRGRTNLTGATVESYGDHRIAMAMAIAGLVASGSTSIVDAEAASVSYPNFWEDLESVTVR